MNGINNNNLGRFKAFLESMGEFGNFSVIFYLGWEYFFDRSDSAPHHRKITFLLGNPGLSIKMSGERLGVFF